MVTIEKKEKDSDVSSLFRLVGQKDSGRFSWSEHGQPSGLPGDLPQGALALKDIKDDALRHQLGDDHGIFSIDKSVEFQDVFVFELS